MTKYLFVLLTLSIHSVSSATQKGFETEVYGFLRASSMYSSDALASYNNINLSPPTHAAPRITSTDKKDRLSFQTQQSRVGFNLKKGDQLSAKLDFDSIDFAKSSPTTQMNPRVRIAAVTYAWENQKVVIGQDWDLFSPVTSFTFDYVGLYFMAGNTGFMRQQLRYLNSQGNWEFGTPIGMAGNNLSLVNLQANRRAPVTRSRTVAWVLQSFTQALTTMPTNPLMMPMGIISSLKKS
jgi:hypothetical protein